MPSSIRGEADSHECETNASSFVEFREFCEFIHEFCEFMHGFCEYELSVRVLRVHAYNTLILNSNFCEFRYTLTLTIKNGVFMEKEFNQQKSAIIYLIKYNFF